MQNRGWVQNKVGKSNSTAKFSIAAVTATKKTGHLSAETARGNAWCVFRQEKLYCVTQYGVTPQNVRCVR